MSNLSSILGSAMIISSLPNIMHTEVKQVRENPIFFPQRKKFKGYMRSKTTFNKNK